MPALGPRHKESGPARARSRESADGACYSLFVPLHYEPRYAYPLIVWLHGPGDSPRQLVRIMPLVSVRNFVAVAPQGTGRHVSSDGAAAGFTWEDHDDGCLKARRRVLDCIEVARRECHVSPRRVYLAGFDCGGTMALRLGLEAPARFAGILSFGGGMPPLGAPLRNLGAVRKMPVFLATGQDSEDYPPDRVAADVLLLHAAGLDVVHQRYSCGQCVTPQMLGDMNRWIIDRIRGRREAGPHR